MGRRGVFALVLALAGTLLALSISAPALNPSLDVSQYSHTAWKIREGFARSRIRAIAQTPDGYLWLGTEFGLLRFDGVRNVPWEPPSGQHLPSNFILRLLVARDGTLWIGTDNGLASWKNGTITHYEELAGLFIYAILEDRDGAVWISGFRSPTGKLCSIQDGSIHCYGVDAGVGRGVWSLYQDSKGNLWAGVWNGLWRWKPGPPTFYSMPDALDSIQAFTEDNGTLLFTGRNGIRRLTGSTTQPYSLPPAVQQYSFHRLLRDRDGGLWLGTEKGLVHVHQGRVDVFTRSDGLTGDDILALFEDREGNIWVATANGLDRFGERAVVTLREDQGLSSSTVWSLLADSDGGVWLGNRGGLNRWKNGQITTVHLAGTKRKGKRTEDAPNSLFQDHRGRIWLSTIHGFGHLEDRFVPVTGFPGEPVHGIAEDNAANLWVAEQISGLFQLSPQGEVRHVSWAEMGTKDYAYALTADPLHGGLWLGFFRGGVAYFKDGGIRASYGTAQGLGQGFVNSFRIDHDGTLWASTAGGLSRLKNGRFATVSSRNGLPCDTVHWMMEDDDHSFWLLTACGLLHIARSDIDTWAAAVDRQGDAKDPKPVILPIRTTILDNSDGVKLESYPFGYRPLVAKSSDGKLWFAGEEGVSVIDPRHIPFNKLPPPVHIEQITANHKIYDAASAANGQMRLPPLVRDLEIDYTALSLVAPEKVRFRYKLDGWDRDWQDAGNRRQAFYGNLPPRNYRFRVIACNNSGVWNEAGALLDFSVAPAYYQTLWFRLACVFAFLALLAGLYRLRVRQLQGNSTCVWKSA